MRYALGAVPLLVLLLLAACARSAPPPEQQTLTFARVVDLSHVITQDMPHTPGTTPTRLLRTADDDSIEALQIGLGQGTALHLPAAAAAEQRTIETLSPRDLVLPAVMLDVRDAAQDTPTYALSTTEIIAWEQEHGRIPAGSMVLIATGWDIRWGSPERYLNLDAQQRPRVPGLSTEAIALLAERGVAGIGSDTPLLLTDAALPARWLLLANLTRIEQLPPTGTTLSIGALRVQAAPASPARVLALVPS
jgi:kynurenine formamidase